VFRRRRLTRAALVLATLVAAGCGGSSTKTVTVTSTPAGSSSATSKPTNQGAPAPTSSPATPAPAPASSSPPVHLTTFQAPSTNIGCVLAGGTARCDIRSRSWSPPARPASCPSVVDFGQGIEVGKSGSAAFVCAGDTALNPGGSVLAYGQDSRVGPFLCQSRTSGLTCMNTNTGHGFALSLRRYSLS